MAIYTNLYLLIFLPVVLVLYQLVPQKARWGVLLAASYALYISFSKYLVLLLMATAAFTYGIGLWLDRIGNECSEKQKECTDRKQKSEVKKAFQKKRVMALRVGVLVLLGILFYVNYYNFVAENMNIFLGKLGAQLPMAKVMFPMGISFYTLEAVGYIADVYWERYPAEKHLGKMALFLSFFPQIMEGPIARYPDTSEALYAGEPLKMENLNEGFLRIIWGLFKKMVVSDRLSYLTTYLFDNYKEYHGSFIILAAIAYTIQLYLEFSGSIDIVIGSGKLFGGVLETLAHEPGQLVQKLCVLPGDGIAAGQELEQDSQKEVRKILVDGGNFGHGAVSGMAGDRRMARSGVEVSVLRNVLFCHPVLRRSDQALQGKELRETEAGL